MSLDSTPGESKATTAPPVPRERQATAPGTLSYDEIRSRAEAQRLQFRHDNDTRPPAPAPGQAIEVWATAGEESGVRRGAVFYTVDGTQPTTASTLVPLEAVTVDWAREAGFLTRWRATLPPQAPGTVLRYRIGGWFSSGAPTQDSEHTGDSGGARGTLWVAPASRTGALQGEGEIAISTDDEGARPTAIHEGARPTAVGAPARGPGEVVISPDARDEAEPDCWAQDGQGFWYRYPWPAGITAFACHVESFDQYCPDWVHDAVIYQIFLDRFHPGTPDGQFAPATGPHVLHGGTLLGVRQALPYLQELGVTCIWLSPFCASPSYHRYDATDYFTVDPALGTNADLRALTGEAHARGLRVMMDFVPAHCSNRHPAFVAAQRDRSAATASWFTFRHWPDQYRTFLESSPRLPSFNGDDPGARQYLIDSAVHWQRGHGIDAFRLDHAIGLSKDFWVAFRRATRAAGSDVFTVGEATDTPDCLRRYRGRLDAVLDFPLAGVLRDTLAAPGGSVSALDAFLTAYHRYMAGGPARVSFLDNHDMNRFLFLASGDVTRLELAALCLFTLPPVPAIYYGTEIALPQHHDLAGRGFAGDAEVRTDMVWDRRHWNLEALASFQALIALRKRYPALRRGSWASLHVDERAGTYAYTRRLEHSSEGELVCAFNLSNATQQLTLPVRGRYAVVYATRGATPSVSGHTLRLPAVSGVVLSISA